MMNKTNCKLSAQNSSIIFHRSHVFSAFWLFLLFLFLFLFLNFIFISAYATQSIDPHSKSGAWRSATRSSEFLAQRAFGQEQHVTTFRHARPRPSAACAFAHRVAPLVLPTNAARRILGFAERHRSSPLLEWVMLLKSASPACRTIGFAR